jgi:hypothetical protein
MITINATKHENFKNNWGNIAKTGLFWLRKLISCFKANSAIWANEKRQTEHRVF